MNFSTVKSVIIPEGAVNKIIDAAGRVLWSAIQPLTLTISGNGDVDKLYLMHNGTKYYQDGQSISVATGDIIAFYCVGNANYASAWGKIQLNGTNVIANDSDSVSEYTWIVPDGTTGITANMSFDNYIRVGVINVVLTSSTDIPVNISGTGSTDSMMKCYVDINGNRYTTEASETTLPGYVISCCAKSGRKASLSEIIVNGETVASAAYPDEVNYIWAVPSDVNEVSIELLVNGTGSSANKNGVITITTT